LSILASFCYFDEVKRCDYCGKQYPDEAVVCAIDANPLPSSSKYTEERAAPIPPPYIAPTNPEAAYPEYRWSARDGWKFIGMIFVFWFLWYIVTGALYKLSAGFYQWRWEPYGYVIMRCAFITMNLLTAAYFARTETWNTFREACGLNKRPSRYVWFGVTFAFFLCLLGHFFRTLGWTHGHTQHDLLAFESTYGPERYLYLFGVVAAAFAEEPVYRGFLYKAFRGSYSTTASVIIVVGYTAFTHWNQFRYFGWAAISLSAITVVQCYLREKSDSLWDTILCHLVYNVSGLFISGLLRY